MAKVPEQSKSLPIAGNLRYLWGKQYMTLQEVSKLLNRTKVTLYTYIRAKKLPVYDIGVGRGLLVRRRDFKLLAKSQN